MSFIRSKKVGEHIYYQEVEIIGMNPASISSEFLSILGLKTPVP
jgi:hypothetical protein